MAARMSRNWVTDYNGCGRWSGEEIAARYRRYCAQLRIAPW
jgi:hypothetical protein